MQNIIEKFNYFFEGDAKLDIKGKDLEITIGSRLNRHSQRYQLEVFSSLSFLSGAPYMFFLPSGCVILLKQHYIKRMSG